MCLTASRGLPNCIGNGRHKLINGKNRIDSRSHNYTFEREAWRLIIDMNQAASIDAERGACLLFRVIVFMVDLD